MTATGYVLFRDVATETQREPKLFSTVCSVSQESSSGLNGSDSARTARGTDLPYPPPPLNTHVDRLSLSHKPTNLMRMESMQPSCYSNRGRASLHE